MLNKLFLAGTAMLLASPAFAQTTTTTTYSSPVSISVGSTGCTISGSTLIYNSTSNSITIPNGTDSCSTGTPPPSTASVSISISPTTYTLGSNAAAPVVSVTNNTPAATVTCTLNPTNGFTVTSAGSITGSGTFALSTPTTQGSFTFTPTCTTSTSGYTSVLVSPGSVSLQVNPVPPVNTGCDATQLSTPLNGITLKRQCSGAVNIMPSSIAYNNALTDLGTVLGNSSFPAYKYAGYSPTFTIQSGYYVALAFTPQVSGAFQLVANTSYGDGGTISLSTMPGALTRGSAGAICVQNANASNSLYISTSSTTCQVTVGTTYFINFADTNINGDSLCYNSGPGTCGNSTVSYTLYR